MNLSSVVRNRVIPRLRRHVLDALDHRGIVKGWRIEFPQPNECALVSFEEADCGPGQLLVENLVTSISPGTESAVFQGNGGDWVTYPYPVGYSAAGRVVKAGPGAKSQVGTVVWTGSHHGSLALVPDGIALPVPQGVSPESASSLQLAYIAIQAVRKARIVPGRRVAVFGAGVIGLFAAQLSRIAGGQVTVVGRSEDRLSVATACDIADTISTNDQGAVERLEADVVIDATGNPAAFNQSLDAIRTGGTIILVGSTRQDVEDVDLGRCSNKNVTVIGAHVLTVPRADSSPGSWTMRRECEILLNLMAHGRLVVERMITDRMRPNEVSTFFSELKAGTKKPVLAIIDWQTKGIWNNHIEANGTLRLAGAAFRWATRRGSPRPPKSAPREDGKVLRLGLVGCGEIAVASANSIRQTANATITFAVDPNEDLARSLAVGFEAGHSESSDALLESDEVDAVLISAPHHLHAPLAIQAVKAGKHVVVEKPMAISVSQCDEMIMAADEGGVSLSVCYCQRYDPRIQFAKHLIRLGVIGDLVSTRISFNQFRDADYWTGGLTGRVPSDWRSKKSTAGGGVLIMNVCHVLDYIGWLVENPVVSVKAAASTLAQGTEVEDTVSVTYQYENGALGAIEATNASATPGIYEQMIIGSAGQIRIGKDVSFWSSKTVDGYAAERWNTPKSLPTAADRRDFFESYANAILDGDEPPVSALEARSVQWLIESAYKSSEADAKQPRIEKRHRD